MDPSTVTNDVLNSSATVLQRSRTGGTVGLQEWFTPAAIASFVAEVVGQRTPVIDITAGSGAMLAGFHKDHRYGIEINPANHDDPRYHQIKGDAQKAVPMMRAVGHQFPAVCINPPYGLSWHDPAHGGKKNSTLLAYEWAQDLLAHTGQGAILLGTDRLDRELMGLESSKAIYAIIDFPSGTVWKSVRTPVSLAFFVNHRNIRYRWSVKDYRIRMERTPDDLRSALRDVTEAAGWAANHLRQHAFYEAELEQVKKNFDAVNKEYVRRKTAQEKGQDKVTHDLHLKKNKIVSTPSAYARVLLQKDGDEASIRNLHHQHINYFAQNSKAWEVAADHERRGILTISPQLKEAVARVVAEREQTATPLFPVPEPMRLGWLPDLNKIKCIKTDRDQGFVAGSVYSLSTAQPTRVETIEKNKDNKDGEPELRQFQISRRILEISISDPDHIDFTTTKKFDESPDSVKYLASHFELPDPGDVATRYPELYEKMWNVLTNIEDDKGFKLKHFQKDHLARLLTKGRGMLAHEQGLGKTLMLMTLAEAVIRLGGIMNVLIVSPQDLIPQWGREAKKFFGRERTDLKSPLDVAKNVFGRELVEIRTPYEARQVARKLKGVRGQRKREWVPTPDAEHGGGYWKLSPGDWQVKPETGGWFITYYEALSQVGKTPKNKRPMPHVYLDPKRDLALRLRNYKKVKSEKKIQGVKWNVGAFREARIPVVVPKEDNPNSAKAKKARARNNPYAAYQGGEPLEDEVMTSKWACPKCKTDTAHGWTGEVCRRNPKAGHHGCGYVHRREMKKPAYAFLTNCFIDGIIDVDELSEMRGESQRSQALRALARGRHKFGGTGTPMSNYIPDAFWGLWWTLGNATAAFPYDYREGRTKFEEDFAVIEYLLGRQDSDQAGKRQSRKVLPKITNVSQFWRLTQPSISRCRKEQTGEPLVKRTYHPTRVPLGVAQKQHGEFWMKRFAAYFTEMNPDHKLVAADLVERFEAALGLGWRMEFSATMPTADWPTNNWHEAKAQDWYEDLSPWTPANLKTLELAAEHAARGEKVLIGSDLIATGKWLSDQLNAKGIKSVHLTEEDAEGNVTTKDPRKRAADVLEFTQGNAMVMCAGVNAMKLGHNLDKASTVIVHGLPYSHMTMDQFIARVHRLTSKKPVNIYVIVPADTIAEQKWQLLKDKAGASDLAFDGELMVQDEEEKDLRAMLKEMRAKGFRATGEEIEEAQIEAEWERFVYEPTVILPPAPKPELERSKTNKKLRTRLAGVRQPIPNGHLPKYTPRPKVRTNGDAFREADRRAAEHASGHAGWVQYGDSNRPLEVACPVYGCKAPAGEECTRFGKTEIGCHSDRVTLWRKQEPEMVGGAPVVRREGGFVITKRQITPEEYAPSVPFTERQGYEPPKKLPAQQAKEEAAEKRRQRPKAKHRKQDTSLFEMSLEGEVTIPVYEQPNLFDVA